MELPKAFEDVPVDPRLVDVQLQWGPEGCAMNVAARLVGCRGWQLHYNVDSAINYTMAYMNDRASVEDRQLLKQLIPKIYRTSKGEEKTNQRRDHLIRRMNEFYDHDGQPRPAPQYGAKAIVVKLMNLYDRLPKDARTHRFRQYMTVVEELINL